MGDIYLHVLVEGVPSWLIDVFRSKRPQLGPLAEEAAAAVRRCPSVWVGDGSGVLFNEIFGDPRAAVTAAEYSAEFAEYEKKKARYDSDVAAGRHRVIAPAPPVKPRSLRDPFFTEVVQEEIGGNFVTLTKQLSRVLVKAYRERASGCGVTADGLEAWLAARIGSQVFLVNWHT